MQYAPTIGRLKCAYCDGQAHAGCHMEELAKLPHFIVPHRIESYQAINALAAKITKDDAYPDDALAGIQIIKTEIVLLPCYRYRYWSTISRRTITKTNYAGRITGLDYARAQWMVEKSTPYIAKYSEDFITDEVVRYDSPYDAQRYFSARPLKHNSQYHTIEHVDYVHVAVARVTYRYEGKEQMFWCTCYRPDKLYSPPENTQSPAFFKPRLGILIPTLVVIAQALGGWLFFRHSLTSWSLLSLAAVALGLIGIPVRHWLYRTISTKRRNQFYRAFMHDDEMGSIQRFSYRLCDWLAMPGFSAVMLGITYVVQRFGLL